MTAEKLKILVVDDEQHQLDTVCRGLFLYDYECVGVLTPQAAIEVLSGSAGEATTTRREQPWNR